MRWWDVADVGPLELDLFPVDAWPVEAFWAELAAGEARAYLVAEDGDGSIVGYAGLSCPSPARGADAEIMTLAVARRAQGRGVGRVLLDALRATAEQRGAGRLLLEVRADNDAALSLYTAAGFEQIGIRAGYYRPAGATGAVPQAVDALVLSLPLPPAVATSEPDSVRR